MALSVRAPAPDLVRAVAPVLLAMIEAMVRPLRVLFWMTTRSLEAAPSRVPPVMIVELLPTFEVTRMPPEVMMFVPLSVRVLAPAALKRRLFVVEFAVTAPEAVTVVLLPLAQVSLV